MPPFCMKIRSSSSSTVPSPREDFDLGDHVSTQADHVPFFFYHSLDYLAEWRGKVRHPVVIFFGPQLPPASQISQTLKRYGMSMIFWFGNLLMSDRRSTLHVETESNPSNNSRSTTTLTGIPASRTVAQHCGTPTSRPQVDPRMHVNLSTFPRVDQWSKKIDHCFSSCKPAPPTVCDCSPRSIKAPVAMPPKLYAPQRPTQICNSDGRVCSKLLLAKPGGRPFSKVRSHRNNRSLPFPALTESFLPAHQHSSRLCDSDAQVIIQPSKPFIPNIGCIITSSGHFLRGHLFSMSPAKNRQTGIDTESWNAFLSRKSPIGMLRPTWSSCVIGGDACDGPLANIHRIRARVR